MGYSGCLTATEVQFLAFFSVLYVRALPLLDALQLFKIWGSAFPLSFTQGHYPVAE